MIQYAVIFAAIFLAASADNVVHYEGYKVYSIYPETQQHRDEIKLFTNNPHFDFWVNTKEKIDVLVAPEAQVSFEQFLRQHQIKFETMIDNLERILQDERRIQATETDSTKVTFDKYHRHDAINTYLKDLAKNFSNIVSLEEVGKSYQNRSMTAIKISSGGNGSRPVILIDGGIHAREWISPAVVLYIIDQLVLNKTNTDMYRNVDWYILPVLNPDGYEYTHTNTRLWRKTRTPGKQCDGVDGNRNFYYHWGSVGSSSSECSETYRGPNAFSEKETWSIASFARKYQNRIKLYLSFHSYGQLILYPWGYTNSPAENGAEHQNLGNSVAQAIKNVNGTTYKVGYSYATIYPNSGSSMDWMKGALNISLSYTVELPDHGYGFVLPPSHINGVVTETFAGVKVFAKYISEKFT